MLTWIGIDISCKQFDAAWYTETGRKHIKLDNNDEGFAKLLEEAPEEVAFVMEATGSYSINLALFLHEHGKHVSVVNPLRTHSFGKAEMSRNKSDKSDAYSIARFGQEKCPKAWVPVTKEMVEIQQLRAFADKLKQQITQLSNQRHAFSQSKLQSADALSLIDIAIKFHGRILEEAMKDLEAAVGRSFQRQIELITSIPGIGKETATRLVALIGDFSRFRTSRQLVSFLGISPTLKQSGTSVHSKGRISRLGNPQIRKALYFCAITASSRNAQCKSMWDRMEANKRPGKLIIMAIANKLIRQIHAVVCSGKAYNPNFANFSLA